MINSTKYRSHTCGELTLKNVGLKTNLCGWVQKRRDHGELIFIDLRDRTGIVQLVFNPKIEKKALERIKVFFL